MYDITIKEMEIDDVYRMRSFLPNKDPLLKSYDFWPRTEYECKFWYAKKTENPRNKYYVIYLDKRPICYLSNKKIDKIKKSSILGIVMDPKFQGKGYGEKIMTQFLEKYFGDMGFLSMTLTVDKWNKRAINLYKKLGFKIDRPGYMVFDGNICDIDSKYDDYFIFYEDFAISKIWNMSLKKEDFYAILRD